MDRSINSPDIYKGRNIFIFFPSQLQRLTPCPTSGFHVCPDVFLYWKNFIRFYGKTQFHTKTRQDLIRIIIYGKIKTSAENNKH